MSDQNETYVRERWERVEFERAAEFISGFKKGRVLAWNPANKSRWILSGNINYPFEFSHALPEAEAWSAARQFTEERLEAIRQLKREIEWLEMFGPAYTREDLDRFANPDSIENDTFLDRLPEYARDWATRERILVRLQAALTDLQRGLKPGG